MPKPSREDRRTLRVVQVSSFAPPHLGGLETCAAGIFRSLRERGVEMEWLTSNIPRRPAEDGMILLPAWGGVEERWGIPVPVPKPTAMGPIWRAVQRADVVHLHDTMYLNCLLAALAARALRKPVLVTIHVGRVPYVSPIARAAQSLALATVGRACLASARAVVVYSRKLLDETRTVLGDRVRMIPNGIAADFLPDSTEVAVARRMKRRSALALPLDRPILTFAGRFVEKKGLPLVRRIAERMPRTFVILCGAGTVDPARWNLPNVRVLGPRTSVELRELFLACDLLLLPSVGEGFPLVIQEAMGCGVPAAILHETWQAWGEGAEWFVCAEPARFENAVAQYLDHPFDDDRRRVVARYARDNWSWDRTARGYEEAYDDVLSF